MKNLVVKSLIFLLPLLFLFSISLPASAEEKIVSRISGENRFMTAVEISKKGWSNGADTILLSVGDNFPDALSGGPLAYSLDAPILLTHGEYIPSVVEKEIERLGAKKAFVLGGKKVISDAVVQKLESKGIIVERVAGQNRYDTSAEIAKRMNTQSDTAIVAFGGNFPDSLAIAAFAAQKGYPILLTDKNALPEATKEALKNYNHTIAVGGEGVISQSVFQQLPNPQRISGDDRYSTAAEIIDKFYEDQKMAYVATGMSFADALTGSVLAAKDQSFILLVQKESVPTPINGVINDVNISQFSILGGPGAVTDKVNTMLKFDLQGLLSTAKSYIGVRYVYGGTTPSGFDCSGYLGYVFKKHGISLPRMTSDIYNVGQKVTNLIPGDLVFYETYKPGPSHAGIYLGNNQFIHSSSSRGVSISDMNLSYWKTRYLGAKRVIQ
jgi:cell wall-associated NlpC family hydrolase